MTYTNIREKADSGNFTIIENCQLTERKLSFKGGVSKWLPLLCIVKLQAGQGYKSASDLAKSINIISKSINNN